MEFCMANISGSAFTNNTATIGSAIRTVGGHVTISNTLFSKNIAADTGAMYIDGCVIYLIFVHFVENTANTLRTVNSNGILYAVDSTLYTSEEILMSGNKAGEASIVYFPQLLPQLCMLKMSRQKVHQLQLHNRVEKLHWFSGIQLTYIIFNGNEAEKGGALAFEMNSRIYGGTYKIIFRSNMAEYGGAIYVDDYSTSGTCASTSYIAYSASTECFIQTLNFDKVNRIFIDKRHYQFVDNVALRSGPSLYGGLLDRCTVTVDSG